MPPHPPIFGVANDAMQRTTAMIDHAIVYPVDIAFYTYAYNNRFLFQFRKPVAEQFFVAFLAFQSMPAKRK